jgi:hypothetical protein
VRDQGRAIRGGLGDAIAGLALIALAGWFYFEAGDIPDYDGPSIGAADFPRGLAILLAIGALILILNGLRRLIGRCDYTIHVRRPLRVFGGALLLLAFPVAMERVGYYPTMTVFLLLFLLLADVRKPLWVGGCVLAFLAFTKLVFEMFLQTPLP